MYVGVLGHAFTVPSRQCMIWYCRLRRDARDVHDEI